MTLGHHPRALGRYVLLVPLAEGGMGSVVIAATVQEPTRLLLVKLLKPGLAQHEDYLPRFLDETKLARALSHDNLCMVLDSGEAAGELFLTMELIEGVTLKRLVELTQQHQRTLSRSEAVAIVVDLLRGLHAAHTAVLPGTNTPLGVVHRDVSPQNAMLDVHGRVKVIDFGLATSVLKETFTESAVVLGKANYMAPEQARGEDTGPAVDQYAAAIMLYELLVGQRFYGDQPQRAIWTLAGAGNHRPSDWGRLPAELATVLERSLASRPEHRFRSCGALADALLRAWPEAASREHTEGLGRFVRELRPRELQKIDEARALAEEIAAGNNSTTEATLTHKRQVTQQGETLLLPDRARGASQSDASDDPGTSPTRRTVAALGMATPDRPARSAMRRALLAGVVVASMGSIAIGAIGVALRGGEPAVVQAVVPAPVPAVVPAPVPTTAAAASGASTSGASISHSSVPSEPQAVTAAPRESTGSPRTPESDGAARPKKTLTKENLAKRAKRLAQSASRKGSDCLWVMPILKSVVRPLLDRQELEKAQEQILRLEKQCARP